MMLQYEEAKQAAGDALLLFRMGDFYELFYEDAVTASKLLGLTLTSRDKGENPIAMAGFPHHQLESYLGKFIQHGYRVAVCEQVEDPKQAKGIVRREIEQIVSPGTVTDQSLLDPAQSNYLVSVVSSKQAAPGTDELVGVAWVELSTGQFQATQLNTSRLADLLTRLNAAELLCSGSALSWLRSTGLSAMLTTRPDWTFGLESARKVLCHQFGLATLEGLGFGDQDTLAIRAAGGVLEYIKETQKNRLDHLDPVTPWREAEYVEIDQATWRSLEVTQTLRGGDREGSLFGVIDRCVTPMGSRQLGGWLTTPLVDPAQIGSRHDAVEEFLHQTPMRRRVRDLLNDVYDLPRLIARVATGRASPRDLSAIGKTLAKIQPIKEAMATTQSRLLRDVREALNPCRELCDELERALVDPCPAHIRDGGFLQEGYDSKLDGYRELARGGKEWIAKYQQTVCDQTGIPSLKVGFNKVFGYYLEVTHTHRDRIPETFIRKQTLKNAERYITPELKEYEEKVLSADESAMSLELELFERLRARVQEFTAELKSNARAIAVLDALAGLAELAAKQNYCRPEMTGDQSLVIRQGRHPVLDIVEPLGAFVPNDTEIDDEHGFLHLITGPNMAGKSTYIRQVALITLLAQIGSFVPAESARIGVVDRIFARVGASDELSRGQSTFMVEMTETARILNTASHRSLVVLDEIGRGTSTYDGVSLAWAIVEFVHDQIGCRTLFATHYHELTELESTLAGVRNFNVAVKEWDDKIVFLHRIVPGSANRSYGIHVAQLAGVPSWVNQRAEQILKELENSHSTEETRQKLAKSTARKSKATGGIQLTLFDMNTHPIVDQLKVVDINQLTPIQALQVLSDWKQEFAREDSGGPERKIGQPHVGSGARQSTGEQKEKRSRS